MTKIPLNNFPEEQSVTSSRFVSILGSGFFLTCHWLSARCERSDGLAERSRHLRWPRIRRLGKRLRQLRKAQGLSQYALARKAGISREYVRKLETGLARPREKTLTKIARVLDMRWIDLMRDLRLPHLQALRDTVGDVERGADRLGRRLEKAGDLALNAFHALAHRADPSDEEHREAMHLFQKLLGAIRELSACAEEVRLKVEKMSKAAAAQNGGGGWLSRQEKKLGGGSTPPRNAR